MNVADMRVKFREGANDLDASLGDGDIDAYLNRAYQYVIPSEVGAEYNKGYYAINTVASQRGYSVPSYVFGAGNELVAYIRDGGDLHFLSVETNPGRWERYQAGDSATEARPSSLLFYAATVTLWPTPDAVYTITIPSSRGRSHSITDSAGATNLADDRLAMACVHAGLMEFHNETQDEVSYAMADREYKRWKRMLMRNAHGRPSRRHPARSF